MIVSELYDLKQFIVSRCKCNAGIGIKDLGPSEYPYVEITSQADMEVYPQNANTNVLDMPVQLRIVTDKNDTIKALEVFERLLLNINQFNEHKGHMINNATPSYVDDTYEIVVSYTLKLIIQKTS